MEFKLDCEPSMICNTIREDFFFYPIEMQLVWLSELLLDMAFMRVKSRDKLRLNASKDKYIFTQRDSRFAISAVTHDYTTYVLLDKFRNEFVHRGSYYAYKSFEELTYRKNYVNALADRAGVTLNWNCSLYEILDIKDC